jgi:hypothetical protein
MIYFLNALFFPSNIIHFASGSASLSYSWDTIIVPPLASVCSTCRKTWCRYGRRAFVVIVKMKFAVRRCPVPEDCRRFLRKLFKSTDYSAPLLHLLRLVGYADGPQILVYRESTRENLVQEGIGYTLTLKWKQFVLLPTNFRAMPARIISPSPKQIHNTPSYHS